jgi:hypothetical protein
MRPTVTESCVGVFIAFFVRRFTGILTFPNSKIKSLGFLEALDEPHSHVPEQPDQVVGFS